MIYGYKSTLKQHQWMEFRTKDFITIPIYFMSSGSV